MKEALVSIIIPLYNSEKYIAETITSALNQTWPNKEIIVVDDGSTDSSLAIVSKFDNPVIKIFKQEKKGASAARNKGLSEAKGKYIQFLDADDLLSPEKIKLQVQVLDKNQNCMVLSDTVHFIDGTDPYAHKPQKEWYSRGNYEPIDFLIKLYGGDLIGKDYGGIVTIHSWLTPRSVIDKGGPWNERLSVDDDGEFFCRVILAGKRICYAPGAINYYRKVVVQKNLSAQNSFKACRSILNSADLKTRALLAATDLNSAKIALSRLQWENAFCFLPQYRGLAREAEVKAKAIAPRYHYNPYRRGISYALSKIIGWKAVCRMQYLKKSVFKS